MVNPKNAISISLVLILSTIKWSYHSRKDHLMGVLRALRIKSWQQGFSVVTCAKLTSVALLPAREKSRL